MPSCLFLADSFLVRLVLIFWHSGLLHRTRNLIWCRPTAVNDEPHSSHSFSCVGSTKRPSFRAWCRRCLEQAGQPAESLPQEVVQSLPHLLQAIATPPCDVQPALLVKLVLLAARGSSSVSDTNDIGTRRCSRRTAGRAAHSPARCGRRGWPGQCVHSPRRPKRHV